MLSNSPALQNCYTEIPYPREYQEQKKAIKKKKNRSQTTTVTLPDTPVSEPLTSDINVDISGASVSLDRDQSNMSMSTWCRGPTIWLFKLQMC